MKLILINTGIITIIVYGVIICCVTYLMRDEQPLKHSQYWVSFKYSCENRYGVGVISYELTTVPTLKQVIQKRFPDCEGCDITITDIILKQCYCFVNDSKTVKQFECLAYIHKK